MSYLINKIKILENNNHKLKITYPKYPKKKNQVIIKLIAFIIKVWICNYHLEKI